MALRVTQEQLKLIITQAQTEAPNECCGMLAGRGDVVEAVFPGRNRDQSPTTYLMHPEDQLRAFREMDERGWELIGIYHSHPRTQAAPSRTDRARAVDGDGQPLFPGAQYVIVSLRDDSRPQVKAFRLTGNAFTEEDVVIS
jgi:[CysO sulfur-carrier protein]-S-L-cysteine hydrolase